MKSLEPFVAAGQSGDPYNVSPAETVADLRFRRRVERLCAKGPRIVGELLAELGAERGIQTLIDEKVDRNVAIDDAALDAIDGRKFSPIPLREVK